MDLWRERIKSIREGRGLSNSQLHQLSGVSKALISQLENGNRPFTQKTLEDLAKALECSLEDFFCSDTHPPRKVVAEKIPADLRLLTDWVMDQSDPQRMAANVRFMVETRYPEFEEWCRHNGGQEGKQHRKGTAEHIEVTDMPPVTPQLPSQPPIERREDINAKLRALVDKSSEDLFGGLVDSIRDAVVMSGAEFGDGAPDGSAYKGQKERKKPVGGRPNGIKGVKKKKAEDK